MKIIKSCSISGLCLKRIAIFPPVFFLMLLVGIFSAHKANSETLRYHTLVVDAEDKILPWHTPTEQAYDHYLNQLWTWLPTVPNGPGSSLPMYYLYNGFFPGNPITPDYWENDWGEKLPNFVEFGRLFYAYNGDTGPLNIAKNMLDYGLDHGITPADYSWPNFPIGVGKAGATEIDGENDGWLRDDLLIDLGSDLGMSYYTMYLIFGDPRYRTAAINTADVLASKIQPGDAEFSPWPYVVNSKTGAMRSRYTSNFAGALTLFDFLIEHGEPNAANYVAARQMLKDWLLQYPMQNGNWVSGHSDVIIDGNTNWDNTTKSNMSLYLLDNPDFDPNFATDVPQLLHWTEDNFINAPTMDNTPGQYHGASVVAEQLLFMVRMGNQTSRQAAEYAEWYAVTGDEAFKDKAYRGFNYVTYLMKDSGESSGGPTGQADHWWGDVYGEGPRMFFHGFKAVPEWAPPGENHILYSKTVLKNIAYGPASVGYTPTNAAGTEYLRLAFLPGMITVSGVELFLRTDLAGEGYMIRDLGNGDYAVTIRRERPGDVDIVFNAAPSPPEPAFNTIWPATATPTFLSYPDTASVELGVKFYSDVGGVIKGVRFYKGTDNTGTHVGNLWSLEGENLATAVFTDETASGWQEVTFNAPVSITAGTTYVVSYFSPDGGYSADTEYFAATGYDNAPLHSPSGSVAGGNGVFVYSTTSAFPTNTFRSNQYWVDIVFNDATSPPQPAFKTIWPTTATPTVISVPDTASVELGVQFYSDVDGFVEGVRFYKGANNTGTHVGNLWTLEEGENLATAVFTDETASGWQEVKFNAPVPITAGKTYVVSYFCPNGGYSMDKEYFATSGYDNAPLHSPSNGVAGGNGMYFFSATSTFPLKTFQSSNYWVDIMFSSGSTSGDDAR